jgi:hypothetical protein
LQTAINVIDRTYQSPPRSHASVRARPSGLGDLRTRSASRTAEVRKHRVGWVSLVHLTQDSTSHGRFDDLSKCCYSTACQGQRSARRTRSSRRCQITPTSRNPASSSAAWCKASLGSADRAGGRRSGDLAQRSVPPSPAPLRSRPRPASLPRRALRTRPLHRVLERFRTAAGRSAGGPKKERCLIGTRWHSLSAEIRAPSRSVAPPSGSRALRSRTRKAVCTR